MWCYQSLQCYNDGCKQIFRNTQRQYPYSNHGSVLCIRSSYAYASHTFPNNIGFIHCFSSAVLLQACMCQKPTARNLLLQWEIHQHPRDNCACPTVYRVFKDVNQRDEQWQPGRQKSGADLSHISPEIIVRRFSVLYPFVRKMLRLLRFSSLPCYKIHWEDLWIIIRIIANERNWSETETWWNAIGPQACWEKKPYPTYRGARLLPWLQRKLRRTLAGIKNEPPFTYTTQKYMG